MELKLHKTGRECCVHILLIVPYGIETNADLSKYDISNLLIVPYGIETRNLLVLLICSTLLLIVPYGIET